MRSIHTLLLIDDGIMCLPSMSDLWSARVAPRSGMLAMHDRRSLEYTPDILFLGQWQFTYRYVSASNVNLSFDRQGPGLGGITEAGSRCPPFRQALLERHLAAQEAAGLLRKTPAKKKGAAEPEPLDSEGAHPVHKYIWYRSSV